MKKTIFTLIALLALTLGASAQNWQMVITHADGTQETLSTTAVKNVSFRLADQYADQIIIKELYNGGTTKDGTTTLFQQDKGFILYNNSSKVAVANNLCIGFLDPYNSNGTNNWYDTNGNLAYANAGYVPALDGIWYFPSALVLQPYEQVVVSCMGSIDNTQSYSQSVNYANKDYYAMYDPESGYSNASYYPAPSEVIPTSHYLKAVRIGQSNAWAMSSTSPAFIIFQTQDVTPADYAGNVDNITYAPGAKQVPANATLKVPNEWVIDGMEVYPATGVSASKKRLPADIDAGYVTLTNRLGHTLYRNVDKEATEALPENKGKLVYGYSLGVTTGDPSGIDAEASIKAGAHIVYQDTNNSTADFHERQKFSIRGE